MSRAVCRPISGEPCLTDPCGRYRYYFIDRYKAILVFPGLAPYVDVVRTYPPYGCAGACARRLSPMDQRSCGNALTTGSSQTDALSRGGVGLCCDAAVSLKSAVVCGASVVKGHWQAAADGADPGRGRYGEVDTNLAGKVQAALLAAEQTPFVLLHQWRRRSRPPAGCGRKTSVSAKWIVLCWQSCWLPGTGSPWSVTMAPTRRRGSIGAVRSLITENKRRYKYAGTAAAAGASCRWMPLRWMRPKTTGRIGKAPGSLGEIGGAVRSGGRHYRTGVYNLSGTPIFWCSLQIMDVVEEGVSSAPKSVTWQQTVNPDPRQTGASVLCRHFGCGITVCDSGVDTDCTDPAVLDRKIARGTQNIARGPAMERAQAIKALEIGAEVARQTPAETFGCGRNGHRQYSDPPAAVLACCWAQIRRPLPDRAAAPSRRSQLSKKK